MYPSFLVRVDESTSQRVSKSTNNHTVKRNISIVIGLFPLKFDICDESSLNEPVIDIHKILDDLE